MIYSYTEMLYHNKLLTNVGLTKINEGVEGRKIIALEYFIIFFFHLGVSLRITPPLGGNSN